MGRIKYPAVCSECGSNTTVPFIPDGKRDVFCKNCFKEKKGKKKISETPRDFRIERKRSEHRSKGNYGDRSRKPKNKSNETRELQGEFLIFPWREIDKIYESVEPWQKVLDVWTYFFHVTLFSNVKNNSESIEKVKQIAERVFSTTPPFEIECIGVTINSSEGRTKMISESGKEERSGYICIECVFPEDIVEKTEQMVSELNKQGVKARNKLIQNEHPSGKFTHGHITINKYTELGDQKELIKSMKFKKFKLKISKLVLVSCGEKDYHDILLPSEKPKTEYPLYDEERDNKDRKIQKFERKKRAVDRTREIKYMLNLD